MKNAREMVSKNDSDDEAVPRDGYFVVVIVVVVVVIVVVFVVVVVCLISFGRT